MSESFKTKAGTELPFLNLKGKRYLQVAHRLVWLREEHPDTQIETTIVTLDENHAIMRAEITINGTKVATAHGREDLRHFPDFLEKAETKAVGRALAMAGFGTQFASELDEGERIVDSPTPRPTPGQEILRVAQAQPVRLKAKSAKSITPNSGKTYDFDLKGEQFGVHSGKKMSDLSFEELSGFLTNFDRFTWATPKQGNYAKKVAQNLLENKYSNKDLF